MRRRSVGTKATQPRSSPHSLSWTQSSGKLSGAKLAGQVHQAVIERKLGQEEATFYTDIRNLAESGEPPFGYSTGTEMFEQTFADNHFFDFPSNDLLDDFPAGEVTF